MTSSRSLCSSQSCCRPGLTLRWHASLRRHHPLLRHRLLLLITLRRHHPLLWHRLLLITLRRLSESSSLLPHRIRWSRGILTRPRHLLWWHLLLRHLLLWHLLRLITTHRRRRSACRSWSARLSIRRRCVLLLRGLVEPLRRLLLPKPLLRASKALLWLLRSA